MNAGPPSGALVNHWTRDEWARRFLAERDTIPHRGEGYSVLAEVVHAAAAVHPITRVLDLGTGDGVTLDFVLRLLPGSSGIGLDFNEEMLRFAGARFADRDDVFVECHDLDAPLPDDLGTFDLVVSSFAIHHCVPDRQRALYGEVLGRLAPGGLFCNLEHVASATPARHREFLDALGIDPADDDPSNKLVDPVLHLSWLGELGFTDADCLWRWRELALLAAHAPGAAAAP